MHAGVVYLFYGVTIAYLVGGVGKYSGLKSLRELGPSSSDFPPDFGVIYTKNW